VPGGQPRPTAIVTGRLQGQPPRHHGPSHQHAARDRASGRPVPGAGGLRVRADAHPHSGRQPSPVSRAPCGAYSAPPGQARSFRCFRPCLGSCLRTLRGAPALRATRGAHPGPSARSGAPVTRQGSVPKATSARGGRPLAGMPGAPACLALGPVRARHVVTCGLRRPSGGRGFAPAPRGWGGMGQRVPRPPSAGVRMGPICHLPRP
jgi:hypothetical protein